MHYFDNLVCGETMSLSLFIECKNTENRNGNHTVLVHSLEVICIEATVAVVLHTG